MQANQVTQLSVAAIQRKIARAVQLRTATMTFAERLAATVEADPVAELFPYGKPVDADHDQWAHVAGRGHVVVQLREPQY